VSTNSRTSSSVRSRPGAREAEESRQDRAEAQISRSNLREQIKDVILQRIVSGAYPPGSRLVETRIAQELGVSQAPVREALHNLEQLGCVVREPFRGCSVRAFSAEELLEAFPVRAALEALAARLAADRITEAQLTRLAELLDEMRDAARRGDAHDQSLANASFHATIVHAAGNATLERQWSLLEPYSRTYISVSQPGLDLLALSERHVPILDALRARDPDAAAAAMHRHLMEAADLLRPMADKELA
jgi:DNA-binding GntR family transcriptional regulator